MSFDQIPDMAKKLRPEFIEVDMGSPPGLESVVSNVKMLIGRLHPPNDFAQTNFAYYRPNEYELSLLNNGGYIEFGQMGEVVQPFILGIFGDGDDAIQEREAEEVPLEESSGDSGEVD